LIEILSFCPYAYIEMKTREDRFDKCIGSNVSYDQLHLNLIWIHKNANGDTVYELQSIMSFTKSVFLCVKQVILQLGFSKPTNMVFKEEASII